MPQVLGWRAWYEDGKTYDSETYKWSDLPVDGFQVGMTYFDDNTKRISMGCDSYGVIDRSIIENNESIKVNETRYRTRFIRGKWIADDKFHNIVNEAMESEW